MHADSAECNSVRVANKTRTLYRYHNHIRFRLHAWLATLLGTDHSCIFIVNTIVDANPSVRAAIKGCLTPSAAHFIQEDGSNSRTKTAPISCYCVYKLSNKASISPCTVLIDMYSSFLGHVVDCLQYGGKAGRSGHVQQSKVERVDTQGVVPDEQSQKPFSVQELEAKVSQVSIITTVYCS